MPMMMMMGGGGPPIIPVPIASPLGPFTSMLGVTGVNGPTAYSMPGATMLGTPMIGARGERLIMLGSFEDRFLAYGVGGTP